MSNEVARVEVGERAVGTIVELGVPVEQIRAAFAAYMDLTQKILTPDDYQTVKQGGKDKTFKKKSAWRKYSTAFNLTELVDQGFLEIERDGFNRPTNARALVVMQATNGRTASGYHECNVHERCCPTAFGERCPKKGWKGHYCCSTGCTGHSHWSHPGDIPATAHTRAKNRAISDMIGAGEVSAEEVTDDGPQFDDEPARAMSPAPAARQATAGAQRGTPPSTVAPAGATSPARPAAAPRSEPQTPPADVAGGAPAPDLYEPGEKMTLPQQKLLMVLAAKLGVKQVAEINGQKRTVIANDFTVATELALPSDSEPIRISRLTARQASILIDIYQERERDTLKDSGQPAEEPIG